MPLRPIALFLAVVAVAVALTGCGGHTSHRHAASPPKVGAQLRLKTGQYECLTSVGWQPHVCGFAKPPKGYSLPRNSSLAGTVEQFDSVTLGTVPRWAHYVAGYVNGFWQTYWKMRGHWPVVVGISVASDNRTYGGADCFDMEPGNPGPWNAGPWARWQISQGNTRPCEYSMLSWMPAIRQSLSSWGVPVCSASQTRCTRLWDADWTYRAHLDPGYAGTQYTDRYGGQNLDASRMATWFYGVAPSPPPPDPLHYNTLTRLELRWTLRYDGARKRHKYDAYRTSVLQPELGRLAHDVWTAAHTAPPRPVSWGYRHRGVRFQALYRRQLGQQVAR